MPFILHHAIYQADDSKKDACAFVLHGIFGSGRNWRGFAKALASARPDLAIVTVDLRNHGESVGAPEPQTLEACAADLEVLAEHLGLRARLVIGHSFGGKVALAYAASQPADLETTWVLDSPPGSGPAGGGSPSASEVGRMIATLGDLPLPVARRSQVTDLLAERGFSRGVSTWMATNLRAGDGGFVWNFDLPSLKAMLADYWGKDYVPMLCAPDAAIGRVHCVRALDSDRWSARDLQQLDAIAATDGRMVHTLADAGHWLHVDQPEALLRLVTQHLAD